MGTGTQNDPWVLTTPPGSSEYTMYKDETRYPASRTRLSGRLHHAEVPSSAIEDLHQWLVQQGDWVLLGAADEKRPAAEGTVEAFGRRSTTPSADGTGCAMVTADALECTFRRSSKPSGSPR